MRSSRTAAAWKECKMKRCILAVALGCLAGTALADVTYTYTGRPLQTGNPAVYLAPLTMVFDFASDGSALLDWSISQPDMGTIDPSNVYTLINKQITDSPAIYFYTDASGAVTDWFVNVEVLDPASPPGISLFSQWAQSWDGVVLGSPPLPYGIYAEEGVPGGFNANSPGTWTASGGVLRNFGYGDRADLATLTSPIPEPAPAVLLLAGWAALAGLRRRRCPPLRR
jgi:hypothetical protein